MNRRDVPLVVWSWKGAHLVLVWGAYALERLCQSALLQPKARANHIRSSSATFQVLVFNRSDDPLLNAVYGGEPVLCYNVLSSIEHTELVLDLIFKRLEDINSFPTIWQLNPHTTHRTRGHVVVVCRENETLPIMMEPLFGTGADASAIVKALHDTNTLSRAEEEDDEDELQRFLGGKGLL